MIEKIFNRWTGRKRRKAFSAWQIELTTRCPLRCRMCIREEEKDWESRDMALEDFRKLLPYLKEVETVVLEGWGESLLHKDLLECIRLVKKEGSQVGFVTSGKGLTPTRASELIQAGIDFIGFSIAGTTAATHDAIRVNSHLPDILNSIEFIEEEKRRFNLEHPRIHLIFLMVKDNLFEVPEIPLFAKKAGVYEVILTNVCHCINTWQESQRVFLWERDKNPYERILRETEESAKKLKVRLKKPSILPVNVPVCEENPLRNLYISVEGEVAPCVYLYPPLTSPFRRIFCSEEHRTEKVSFGNLFREPFSDVWHQGEYERFRDRFVDRGKVAKELYYSLWDSPTLLNAQNTFMPEPPEPCRTCHKILGI
jgi:MoaA/NifB/PqqE/SkfB family radical SAM enzyme